MIYKAQSTDSVYSDVDEVYGMYGTTYEHYKLLITLTTKFHTPAILVLIVCILIN